MHSENMQIRQRFRMEIPGKYFRQPTFPLWARLNDASSFDMHVCSGVLTSVSDFAFPLTCIKINYQGSSDHFQFGCFIDCIPGAWELNLGN